MMKHLGKREREARKRKKRGGLASVDRNGVVTLKLGRKKFSEAIGNDVIQLKKKFAGCVVKTER